MIKTYILYNKEQIISDMPPDELRRYCTQHALIRVHIEASFAYNDWNWIRQYPSRFLICAKSVDEAKQFILKEYYHADEYDGERGVIFRRIEECIA